MLLGQTTLAADGLPGQRVSQIYGFGYSRNTLLRAARSSSS